MSVLVDLEKIKRDEAENVADLWIEEFYQSIKPIPRKYIRDNNLFTDSTH